MSESKSEKRGVIEPCHYVTCATCDSEIAVFGAKPNHRLFSAGWTHTFIAPGAARWRCSRCSSDATWCSGHQKLEDPTLFAADNRQAAGFRFQRYCKQWRKAKYEYQKGTK